jgi:hypothetical protein
LQECLVAIGRVQQFAGAVADDHLTGGVEHAIDLRRADLDDGERCRLRGTGLRQRGGGGEGNGK